MIQYICVIYMFKIGYRFFFFALRNLQANITQHKIVSLHIVFVYAFEIGFDLAQVGLEIHSVLQDAFPLRICRPPPPDDWEDRHVAPCPVYAVFGIRAQGLLYTQQAFYSLGYIPGPILIL